MKTPVKPDQFKITDEGIEHVPTGWAKRPYPGQPFSFGPARQGKLGCILENGDDHRPHEVEEMADKLWKQHVETSPGFAEWRKSQAKEKQNK